MMIINNRTPVVSVTWDSELLTTKQENRQIINFVLMKPKFTSSLLIRPLCDSRDTTLRNQSDPHYTGYRGFICILLFTRVKRPSFATELFGDAVELAHLEWNRDKPQARREVNTGCLATVMWQLTCLATTPKLIDLINLYGAIKHERL